MKNQAIRIETMITFHGCKPVEPRIKEFSKDKIEARKRIEERKYNLELKRELEWSYD